MLLKLLFLFIQANYSFINLLGYLYFMFGFLKSKDGKSIESWIMVVQGGITFLLFLCFIFLLVASVVGFWEGTMTAVNTFLPIISGWIGVVLGFFFSREIGKHFEDRLHKTVEGYEDKVEEIEQASKSEMERIKSEFEHIISDKQEQINRLRHFIDRYRERRLNEIKKSPRIKRRSKNGK
jgi:hypothetical protein